MNSTPQDVAPEFADIPTEKLNVLFNPKIIQSTMQGLFKREELEPFFSAKRPVVVIPGKGKSYSDYLTRVAGTDIYTIPKSKIGLSPHVHDIILILFQNNDHYYASQCEVKRVDRKKCEIYSVDLRREKRIQLDCQAQVFPVPETVKHQLLTGNNVVRRILRDESFVAEIILEGSEAISVIEEAQLTRGTIKDISIGGLKLQIEEKTLDQADKGSLLYIKSVFEGSNIDAGFSLFAVVRAVSGGDDVPCFIHCSFLEVVDILADFVHANEAERSCSESGPV